MDVTLKIRRYNPETDREPHWETYRVEAEPTDRVLDLLHQVKWYQDGTLTFRRSCAHGVCGSDAMLINGRNRLACEYLVKDAGTTIKDMLPKLIGCHYHDIADPAWFGLIDFKVLLLEKPGGAPRPAYQDASGYRWYSQK